MPDHFLVSSSVSRPTESHPQRLLLFGIYSGAPPAALLCCSPALGPPGLPLYLTLPRLFPFDYAFASVLQYGPVSMLANSPPPGFFLYGATSFFTAHPPILIIGRFLTTRPFPLRRHNPTLLSLPSCPSLFFGKSLSKHTQILLRLPPHLQAYAPHPLFPSSRLPHPTESPQCLPFAALAQTSPSPRILPTPPPVPLSSFPSVLGLPPLPSTNELCPGFIFKHGHFLFRLVFLLRGESQLNAICTSGATPPFSHYTTI